jgi:hypothetical protein
LVRVSSPFSPFRRRYSGLNSTHNLIRPWFQHRRIGGLETVTRRISQATLMGPWPGIWFFSAGRIGQAFQFDGVDDEISFGAEAGNFGAGDFTVEFWMKASDAGFWAILAKREFCNHGSFWECGELLSFWTRIIRV